MNIKALLKSIIFICILISFIGFLNYKSMNNVIISDEVDYKQAIEKGLFENWAENNSMSLFNMIAETFKDLAIKGDIDVYQTMQKNKDVLWYRHFHPPLSFYVYIIGKHIFGPQEAGLRGTTFLISILFILAFFFLPLKFFNYKISIGHIFAVLFTCLSAVFLIVSTQISPHMLYALIAFLAIYYNVLFLKTKNSYDFYLWCCFVALSFLTVEYAPLLVMTFLISICIFPNPLMKLTKNTISLSFHLLYGVILGVLICALLWFAGIFKFKMAIVYGTIICFPWLIESYYKGALLQIIFNNGPAVIFFGSGFVIFLYVAFKNKIYINFIPFFIYGMLSLILNIKTRFMNPQYVFNFLPYIFLIWGVSFQYFWDKSKRSIRIITLILIAVFLYLLIVDDIRILTRRREISSVKRARLEVLMKEIKPGNRILLGDKLDSLPAYFSNIEFSVLVDEKNNVNEKEKLIGKKYYNFIVFYRPLGGYRSFNIHEFISLIERGYSRDNVGRDDIMLFRAKPD